MLRHGLALFGAKRRLLGRILAGQQTRENLGKVADLCSVDSDHMGPGRNPDADELDGCCTATKGWRRLPGD